MIENVVQMLLLFDVFLLTSVAEGTPVVILEAISIEIPVVATDVGGVSEQVINGETGILVPPKNPEAISRAVIRLALRARNVGFATLPTYRDLAIAAHRIFSDATLAEKFSRNCKNVVKSVFSIERVVDRLELIYEETIRGLAKT